MTAISNYVAQNFGAGRWDRIRQGVRACLIQTEAFNLIMCIGILLLRHPIVRMFLSDPTKEIYHYSDMYLTIVTPFYFVLGLLAVYRTSIQSMQNGKAPFAACMIELVMRIAATVGLSGIIGYTSVCIASPMAWIGACALLIPVYYKMMKGNCAALLRMELSEISCLPRNPSMLKKTDLLNCEICNGKIFLTAGIMNGSFVPCLPILI